VLEMSWTEPFAVLTLAATVACALRWPRMLPVALGLFLGSKQYAPIGVILFFVGSRTPREAAGVLIRACIVALVLTLPLALWNLPAFYRSVIQFQIRQPFRPDSLSYLAWVGEGFWPKPALVLVPLAVLLLSMGTVLWRRRSVGFAAAIALCLLLFFAFSKQAFANYYFFIIGAMACAMVDDAWAFGADFITRLAVAPQGHLLRGDAEKVLLPPPRNNLTIVPNPSGCGSALSHDESPHERMSCTATAARRYADLLRIDRSLEIT
jgi:hypothetical protein